MMRTAGDMKLEAVVVPVAFARKMESEHYATDSVKTREINVLVTENRALIADRDKLRSDLEKEWIKNAELREQIERLKDKNQPCRICGGPKTVRNMPDDTQVPFWLCNAPANYAHQHAHDEPANDELKHRRE